MPTLNYFTWIRLCVCVLAGAWCTAAVAQTQVQAKRLPSAQSTVAKRPPPREADDEEPVLSSPPRSGAGTRPRTNGQAGAGAGRAAVQPGRAAVQQAPPARPQGQAMRIRKVTPEMEAILKEWEEKSAKVKRLEGTFERTTYDNTFNVQKVSTGKYCFQFPDKGSFHQTGTEVRDGDVGRKSAITGQPYRLKSGPNERWICDGEKIFKFEDNEKSKIYDEIEIPLEDRGQNIKNAPLPFVFGMKAAEAKQRYEFELDAAHTNAKTIRMQVRPLLPMDSQNYSKADVILDRATCLPLAVRLTDPTGFAQDVYSFAPESRVVNGTAWGRWFKGDPLKPSFAGYKKAVRSDDVSKLANQPDAGAAPQMGPRPLAPREKLLKTVEVPEEEAAAPPTRKSATRPRPRID